MSALAESLLEVFQFSCSSGLIHKTRSSASGQLCILLYLAINSNQGLPVRGSLSVYFPSRCLQGHMNFVSHRKTNLESPKGGLPSQFSCGVMFLLKHTRDESTIF